MIKKKKKKRRGIVFVAPLIRRIEKKKRDKHVV